jgi:putative GTP pyrophosphokinase
MATSGNPSLSKTQLDRLGEKLRLGTADEGDLRSLAEHRLSFRPAYEAAAAAIKDQLGLDATGRQAKTTAAITEKLRRQSIRLTQIQDIAGLRIVVPDLAAQDAVVAKLITLFPAPGVDDRRLRPSHGYRAVHIIVVIEGNNVEIQVRTLEQHLWAELSERIADRIDPAIKYGGGPASIQRFLGSLSQRLAQEEVLDAEASDLQRDIASLKQAAQKLGADVLPASLNLEQMQESERRIAELKAQTVARKGRLAELLKNLIEEVKMAGAGES